MPSNFMVLAISLLCGRHPQLTSHYLQCNLHTTIPQPMLTCPSKKPGFSLHHTKLPFTISFYVNANHLLKIEKRKQHLWKTNKIIFVIHFLLSYGKVYWFVCFSQPTIFIWIESLFLSQSVITPLIYYLTTDSAPSKCCKFILKSSCKGKFHVCKYILSQVL